MSYTAFLIQALLISLSGVLAPGPLTVVLVGKGARSPHAGSLIALGHGVVEFPLMALIVLGLGPVLARPIASGTIGLAGGLLLLWMGLQTFRSLRGSVTEERYAETSPFVAGMLMSAWNPYFIIWWVTVGATLVYGAWEFGVWQFVLFAVMHWSLDFIWDSLLSITTYRGTKLLGPRFLKGVTLVCGVLLLFFGGKFALDALAKLT